MVARATAAATEMQAVVTAPPVAVTRFAANVKSLAPEATATHVADSRAELVPAMMWQPEMEHPAADTVIGAVTLSAPPRFSVRPTSATSATSSRKVEATAVQVNVGLFDDPGFPALMICVPATRFVKKFAVETFSTCPGST